MTTPRILAFAGSARKDSFNKKLLRVAVAGADAAGAQVTVVDLADYPMPLYDGDLEVNEGQPENARKLRAIFLENDGLLLACPEYNSGITPLLKNTIDWVSRDENGKGSLTPYQGKVAALLAASPGALGGIRGLPMVRSILSNIGVIVLPNQRAISQAGSAFDEVGGLKDPKQAEQVAALGKELAETIAKLKA